MRHLALIVSTAVVCLFYSTVYAQETTAAALLAINKKMVKHMDILKDMRKGVRPDDRFNVDQMWAVVLQKGLEANAITDLLIIREKMLNQGDRETVNDVFTNHKILFADSCNESIKYLNVMIGSAQSPGLALEGEHLRGDIMAVCDRVRSIK